MDERSQAVQTARALALAPLVARTGLLALAVVSLSIRPLTDVLGLPEVVNNLDALLLPVLAAGVLVLLLREPSGTGLRRLLPALPVVLAVAVGLSWLLAERRTTVSLGLGLALLVLLPLALFVAAVAATDRRSDLAELAVLRLLVLVQLGFGMVQYFVHDVAARAPYAADVVDGSSSHNFWPAFALPASLVLALLERGPTRWLWPAAVAVLAVYGEAKAALLVWLPAMLLVALVAGALALHRRRGSLRPDLAAVLRALLVVAFVAVVGGGLLDNSSVRGTWQVLVGHTEEAEGFVKDEIHREGPPTLRDALTQVPDALTDSPLRLLVGLGPGNSVSHEAEVLAQGPRNGGSLPSPGPVAQRLLADTGDLRFEDAQSTLLGIWGDLGVLGALAYAAVTVLAGLVLVTCCARGVRGWPMRLALPLFVGGLLGGGLPLDWPEQASIVLPVMVAMVAGARGSRADPSPSVA